MLHLFILPSPSTLGSHWSFWCLQRGKETCSGPLARSGEPDIEPCLSDGRAGAPEHRAVGLAVSPLVRVGVVPGSPGSGKVGAVGKAGGERQPP